MSCARGPYGLLGGLLREARLTLRILRRHVGLIKIQGKEFEFEPIRLRSVRPFVFEEISLLDYHEKQTDDRKKLMSKVAVTKYLKTKVRPATAFQLGVFLSRVS